MFLCYIQNDGRVEFSDREAYQSLGVRQDGQERRVVGDLRAAAQGENLAGSARAGHLSNKNTRVNDNSYGLFQTTPITFTPVRRSDAIYFLAHSFLVTTFIPGKNITTYLHKFRP